jgi:superfamily I DNA/RNA helicase
VFLEFLSAVNISVEVSTAHAAKGRQYRVVILASDYLPLIYRGQLNKLLSVGEVNVLYTAVSRAQTRLLLPQSVFDVTQSPYFCRPKKKPIVK